MANILISAVSATYNGTPESDSFQRSTGNLRNITVIAKGGDDVLALGSAVTLGTGAGGLGLGFSIQSSTILMNSGADTYTFSGQAGSGFAKQASTEINLGQGDDFALINGLASASAANVIGASGADELGFIVGPNTGFKVLLLGNTGADVISATFAGEAKNIEIYGGRNADTISASFASVSAWAGAAAEVSGTYIAGNSGDDVIGATALGTSEAVVMLGNSGADTLNFRAFNDISGAQVLGGRANDQVSATIGGFGVTSQAVAVAGSQGDDSAALTVAGGFLSAVQLQGNSGADTLTFTVNGVTTAGAGNGVFGGSGTDSIDVNLFNTLRVAAPGGFITDLGTEASGGTIKVLTTAGGSLQGPASFVGSTAGDTLGLTIGSGGGNVSGATFSGNAGADVLGAVVQAGGAGFVATKFFGGAGGDTLTASFRPGNYYNTGGTQNVFDGGADADSIALAIGTGAPVTAISAVGGLGADTLTLSVATGGEAFSRALNTGGQSAFTLAGGSGADVIGLAVLRNGNIDAEVLGGSGADLITGTIGRSASMTGLTADGGLGNDTLSFTVASTAGAALESAVLLGGGGVDSITVAFQGIDTGGTRTFGKLLGGDEADLITLDVTGTNFATAGTLLSGDINAGLGADSILFAGLTGDISDQITGVSFGFKSGDSLVNGFDTITFTTTAGNGALSGVSATFSGFANDAFATASSIGSGGAFTAGFNVNNNAAFARVGITGGLVTFNSLTGGGNSLVSAGREFIVASGAAATTANIISAVDRVAVGVNRLAVFNIANGSAGAVNGYLFIQGGVNPDTVVRLGGLAQSGPVTSADLVFRAGNNNFTVTNPGGGGSGGIRFGSAL